MNSNSQLHWFMIYTILLICGHMLLLIGILYCIISAFTIRGYISVTYKGSVLLVVWVQPPCLQCCFHTSITKDVINLNANKIMNLCTRNINFWLLCSFQKVLFIYITFITNAYLSAKIQSCVADVHTMTSSDWLAITNYVIIWNAWYVKKYGIFISEI